MAQIEAILTTEQLAETLNTPVHTIHYWRAQGTGPRGIRIGKRVAYRWSDVETWLDERAADDPMLDRPQHRRQAR